MHMSAKCSGLVRRYLFNTAKSAIQHYPAVHDLYARLRTKGARGDVALGHCVRKLLHQVFGVWASNEPFDEKKSLSRQLPGPEAPSTIPPAEDPGVPSETKTAAGHTRDVLPRKKVVTAANVSVAPFPRRSINLRLERWTTHTCANKLRSSKSCPISDI